jgi:hypothetical protein
MGTITNTVEQRMEKFRQMQIRRNELTQPGWEDAAGCIRERDKKYSTTELSVPGVVQPQTNDSSLAPPSTTL